MASHVNVDLDIPRLSAHVQTLAEVEGWYMLCKFSSEYALLRIFNDQVLLFFFNAVSGPQDPMFLEWVENVTCVVQVYDPVSIWRWPGMLFEFSACSPFEYVQRKYTEGMCMCAFSSFSARVPVMRTQGVVYPDTGLNLNILCDWVLRCIEEFAIYKDFEIDGVRFRACLRNGKMCLMFNDGMKLEAWAAANQFVVFQNMGLAFKDAELDSEPISVMQKVTYQTPTKLSDHATRGTIVYYFTCFFCTL